MPAEITFWVHGVSTLMLTGVVWFLQVVHYPLFQFVPREGFSHYAHKHSVRAGIIVAPLMLIEILTAVLLLWWAPEAVPAEAIWAGLGLLVVILAATTFLHVPYYQKLTFGFKEDVMRALIGYHWIRTGTWSLRSGLVVWMILKVVQM